MTEIDPRCFPEKNEYFAHMLDTVGFDWQDVTPEVFHNPVKNIDAGIVFPRRRDLVLVLFPDMGTGVAAHEGRLDGTVGYMGLVVPGVSPILKHKYQNDDSLIRDETNDVVLNHYPGETFKTQGFGRLRGYHNMDKNYPIALRIRE